MKRLIIIAGIMLCCCGCADTTEIGDRAIIQLAAVDCEDGEYTLSALLFSAGGSGGELDVTQSNVIKVTGSGKTLGEAVKELSLIDGKEIYMSEAKLLVLGSGFEETDIISVMTMLHRDMRCSLNMPVCFAESASLLTDLQFTEGITAAEKPVDMIKNAFLSGVSPMTTVLDILSDSAGGRDTLIPSFAQAINGSGMTSSDDGRTAALNGARLISGGKFTQTADLGQTAGYMLLSGLSDSVVLNITDDSGEYSCEAYHIDVDWEDGVPTVSADYRSRAGKPLSYAQERACHEQLHAAAIQGLSLFQTSSGEELAEK